MGEHSRAVFEPLIASAAERVSIGEWTTAAYYDDPAREYEAAAAAALVDRGGRGLLEITGADRASWLHNIVTNQVKVLQPGDGNYAFALDVKGRILFDLTVLVRKDSIWVDLDARWAHRAVEHFGKYIVTEDVQITDRSGEFVRIGILGRGAVDILTRHGLKQAVALAVLQHGTFALAGHECVYLRDDHCGVFGVQLLFPAQHAEPVWGVLHADPGVTLVGYDAVDTLRIEAGLPWPVTEINDDVLPSETRHLNRAVSFNKGCYLGQEIVERMRARQSLARRLVLIRFEAEQVPQGGASLVAENRKVGQVTSARHSPKHGAPLALGYVRVQHSEDGARISAEWVSATAPGQVIPLPASH